MKAITAGKMVMAAPLGLCLPAGFLARATPITFSGYHGSGLNPGSNLDSGAIGGNCQHLNTSGRGGATTRLSTTGTGAFRSEGNFDGNPGNQAVAGSAGFGVTDGVSSSANTGHISAARVCPPARIHHMPLGRQGGRRRAGRLCNFIVTKNRKTPHRYKRLIILFCLPDGGSMARRFRTP
jgi:hypothetical protein